ncbi:MAG: hypothetical protein FJW30_17030 [Acidobacteria bacterium]|nr:hypothetical protein [Acidobacteriota bacterium]
MSFLDNLENALNQMERGNDKEAERADRERRLIELEAAKAVAPLAEQLKRSPFTDALLTECMKLGHALRLRIGPAWIGSNLRLEAREKRLELQPTPEGIVAVYSVDGAETRREAVDLSGDGAELARDWLR